jgi:transcriptional regulator GlxA family with amidase domain
VPVEELAARLDVSARQLERLFKADTGSSPQAYAKRLRLRTAAWLLTHSDKSVATVASTCGFADASHLGREFRKVYGMSPAAFRERGGGAELAAAFEGDDEASIQEVFPARTEFY